MPKCSVDDCPNDSFARTWCRKHYMRWWTNGTLDPLTDRAKPGPKPVPLHDRFWSKVERTDTCWLWIAAKTGEGYGVIGLGPGRGNGMAHRVAYELAVGAIPDGMHIDHLCRTPACVNPAHLEPVTNAENTARGYAPSIGASHQLAKTHCPRGHEYSEANTRIDRRGARVCRTCSTGRRRAHAEAKRKGVPYVNPYPLVKR